MLYLDKSTNFMEKDSYIKYLIGVDEVGRGPIAGPVCVASFMMLHNYELPINDYKLKLPKLRDSKKLTKKQREKWFDFLVEKKKEGSCDFAVSFVSPENIDKFGIAKCIKKALDESIRKLNVHPSAVSIYLDGGLKASDEYIYQETIIKGDELHPVISLASIVAKVSRDRVMYRYAKEFPEYGFEKHVGYGTRAHYKAIEKHGKLPIHRKTFIH